MSDPYSILGVDRNATDEDVKKAYRKLSRQYHPDANINNPKKDEAEAKFKEVQQAYQQIMDEREKGYTSGYGSSDGSGYGGYDPFGGFGGFGSYGYGSAGSTGRTSGMSEEDAHLNAAANYIRSGHYKEALNVLDGISQHSARWYFYSASANSGLGTCERSSSSGTTEYAVSDVTSTAGRWRKLVSDKTDNVRISGNL